MSTSGIHTYTNTPSAFVCASHTLSWSNLGLFLFLFFLGGECMYMQGGGVYMHVWRSETDVH